MNHINKGRGKYRFNVIDVLLLLVIVLSVCAIVFLFFYNGEKNDADKGVDTVEIIYTVEQSELPDILRGKVSMGDSVTDTATMQIVGQVIDVEYTDALYTAFDPETNTPFEAVYPGKINMKVRISVEAVMGDDGVYSVNGCTINSGDEMELRFPYYTGNVMCVSVSEVSE